MTPLSCFLLGALSGVIVSIFIARRNNTMDIRLVDHIRRNAYRKGWKEAKDGHWSGEA